MTATKPPTLLKSVKDAQDLTSVSIKTEYKRYGRVYHKDVKFHCTEFDKASWSWLFPALEESARQSQLKPLSTQEFEQLHRGLMVAKRLTTWKALVSLPVQEATSERLIDFLAAFDNEMSCSIRLSPAGIAVEARRTRQYVKRYAAAYSNDGRVARLDRLYRSPLQHKHAARKLISDLPDQKRPIAAAIPHLNLKDYDEKLRKTLGDDLERIREACHQELKRFQLAMIELRRMKSLEIPCLVEEEIRENLQKDFDAYIEPFNLPEEKLEYLLIFTVQLAANLREPIVAKRQSVHFKLFRHSSKLFPMLSKRLFDFANGMDITYLVRMEECPPVRVLLVCALILQAHTGWNFSSILELRRKDIEIRKFPHELQSIKSKTADNTPFSFIEQSDEAAVEVCSFLVGRIDRLIDCQLVDRNEQRLWLSSKSLLGKGPVQQVSGWQSCLQDLCRQYGLPNFSLEQLRGQKLAIETLGARGVQGARQLAGHASSITTLGYFIDSLLLQRRNAANTLEFERRFDATIRYMMDPQAVSKNQLLIAFPIGDGASCSNPQQPPDEAWINAGICAGKNCHVGGGCSNRRLIITRERIEEVIQLKLFYEVNWRRLANENIASFEANHQPALLFNLALYGALKRGPYRHLVSKYEA